MQAQASAVLELRAQRYWDLHLQGAIKTKTNFFAAAAGVTRAFARWDVSPFFQRLSAALEVFNLNRARAIRAGRLYPFFDVAANTAEFISCEQAFVELRLKSLAQASSKIYRREIAVANRALRSLAIAPTYITPLVLRPLQSAVIAVRDQNGRLPCYESRTDREMIGRRLALVTGLSG